VAVASPSPSATTSGEQAGADAFAQAGTTGSGGAFRLAQGAYNGQTVYWGQQPGGAGGRGQAREAEGGGSQPVWKTPEEAYQQYFQMTDKQRQDLQSAGVLSGQLPEKAGDLETSAWWKSLVEQSARYGAAGVQVTPMDLASGYLGTSDAMLSDKQKFDLRKGGFPSGAIFDSKGQYTRTYREGEFVVNEVTGERSYVGPEFKTHTATRVDLTDPQTAKALTRSIFQQLVGRDPVAGEYGKFADALKAAEQANPTVENVTEQYDSQGNVIATNTQAVGALRGALSQQGQQQTLEDLLKQTKEYGTQQAATTYMDATKRAIWGGPTG
jgi:hypothetical protein